MPAARLSSFQVRLVVLLAAVLASAGCTRAYYRRQADAEAYALVREKSTSPHWSLENYSIAIDPRSRMYNQFSPDRPPLPPDDPTAHQFMHCVDGKRGFPGWHDSGEMDVVENPVWPEYLQPDDNGVMPVTGDDAVRMALLHNRTYQVELETLYLSALDVSFERFRFDAQGFAGLQTAYGAGGSLAGNPLGSFGGGAAAGRVLRGNQPNSLLQVGTFSSGQNPVSLQKMFSTGSTLVVGMANSLVWQFAGPTDYSGSTLLNFALVQPLLRNGGRDRVLERLTLSERILLTNVRAMEQYRGAFYVFVMTGRDPGSGPNRGGGVFGSGFDGFVGVGGGGFGRVATTNPGGASASGGNGAGAAAVGGYLGLLQSKLQIRNQDENVKRLRGNLFRLEQTLEELKTRSGDPQLVSNILRQDLQVAQARQALFNSESLLLNAKNDYQSTLDSYKINTLGLPPQVCLDIRDTRLKDFELVADATIAQQAENDKLILDVGVIRQRITSRIKSKKISDPGDPTITRVVRALQWYPELERDLGELKESLTPLGQVRDRLLEQLIPSTAVDVDRFAAVLERRKTRLTQLKAKIELLRKENCPLLPVPEVNKEVFRLDKLDISLAELRRQLDVLRVKAQEGYAAHLREREQKIDAILARGKDLTAEALFSELYEGVLYPKEKINAGATQVGDLLVVLPADLLSLQLVQAKARAQAVDLTPVEIRAEEALEVARKYRRDWMNARAALVDSWRLIRFNADQLQSGFNILLSGDITNTSDNPLRFNGMTGHLRTGFQFDAPITRLAERNAYRQALIEYQQARRSYYAFEDNVARGLRQELRTVANNEINFEQQRLAVLEAARQVDRNEDIRIDGELSNQAAGVTAARDSVSALTDLLNAQNNFLSIWVNYESLRQSIDLDLGTIQVNCEGLWIDPGEIGHDYGKVDPWLRQNGDVFQLESLQTNEESPLSSSAPQPTPRPRSTVKAMFHLAPPDDQGAAASEKRGQPPTAMPRGVSPSLLPPPVVVDLDDRAE